jgi:poly-gamma-glutamate synthesis protein (capsule biosynthesis protein)
MPGPSIAETTFENAHAGETTSEEWSVRVAGDTFFEEGTSSAIGDDLRATLAGADLSVGNLEAPLAGPGEPIAKTGPVNEAGDGTPDALRTFGFDAVTLANNHAMDFGPEGLRHTVERCETAGLATCGVGEAPADALEPTRFSVADQSVAIVSVCEREFGVADRDGPGTAWIDHPDARQTIRDAASTDDVVIVIAHGGVEYLPVPPPGHQRRLRGFVEAGADLVVGHHPHVPQGWETYRGTPIAYSLGNFRYPARSRPKTQWGLLLDATFSGSTLASVALRPVERREEAVAFAGERWSADEFRPYVDRASTITADREALRAHWQELAVRIFEQRYARWLRIGTGSDPLSMLRHPVRSLGGRGLWDGDRREDQLLTLLNLVRNESHSELVETALAVKTGKRADRRTPAVRDTVRELLATTEDEPVYDPPSPTGRLVRAALSHLQESVRGTGRRLAPRGISDRL